MAKKQKSLTRVGKVYGKNGRIPVGRTKFYEDYVATGRLTLVPLGLRAKAVDDDEIDRVIEEDIAAAHRKRNSRHGRSMP